MADSKEIGKWLIANSKHLNLKVIKANWIKDWLPQYFDVHVEITVDGILASGSSIDSSEDLAFIKAGAEAIERIVCKENNSHSNGIAAHVNEVSAKENAQLELIERDSFLSHYISKEPFISLTAEQLKNTNYLAAKSKLEALGFNITIYRMKTVKSTFAFVCFCNPINDINSFSTIIGLGCSTKEEKAFNKSLFECLPNVIWYINNKGKNVGMSKEEFELVEKYNPSHHKNLFLSNTYRLEIQRILQRPTSKINFDESEININFNRLFSKTNILSDCPVKVFQAESQDVLNMFYGPTILTKTNVQRLKKFVSRAIDEKKINLIPHCLG